MRENLDIGCCKSGEIMEWVGDCLLKYALQLQAVNPLELAE